MIEPAILRAMLAAGVTAEQIVVAVEAAIECDKARRAQHAEWKRKRRMSMEKKRSPDL